MKSAKYQVGASFAGWMLVIVLVVSAIVISAKLVPLYMDHSIIAKQMDAIAAEDGMAAKSKRELTAILKNKLKVNQIRDFPLEENLEVEKTRNGTVVRLNYEVRLPLIKNIDLIASFGKEVELRD